MIGEQKTDGAVSVPVDTAKAGCSALSKTARVVYEQVP